MNKITSIFDNISDKATAWIGSTASIIVHTILFIGIFVLHFLGVAFDAIMLVLTTLVSLEAIYLAIFIQRSVNQQAVRLHEVEESLDEVEESLDDVEESIEEDDREDEQVYNNVQKQLEEILKELKTRGQK